MALNFPDNPSLNDIYRDSTSGFNYQWNGTVWKSFSDQVLDEIKILDDISGSFDGNVVTFAITSNSSAIIPANAQQLRIVLDDVVQKPITDYTVNVSDITFTTAPTLGLSFSGVSFGSAIPINTIDDGAITPAKLSTGTPTWNANGDLNIAGVVTATSGSFDTVGVGTGTFNAVSVAGTGTFGSLNVTGTLTYQNVDNVNSTGVITASQGIRVGSGQSIGSISGAETVVYYGDGSNLSGIDATSLKDTGGNIKIQANESGAVVTGILTAPDISTERTVVGILTATTLGVSTVTVTDVNATSLITVGSGITISGVNGITLNEATNASQIVNPLLVNYAEKVNTLGNTGANATIDVSDGTYVTATLDQSCTFTFTSPPTGKLYGFALQLTNGGTGPHTITWPGTVKWPGGSVPARTTTDAKTDIWSFFTSDGGTNWYGSLSLFNFS